MRHPALCATLTVSLASSAPTAARSAGGEGKGRAILPSDDRAHRARLVPQNCDSTVEMHRGLQSMLQASAGCLPLRPHLLFQVAPSVSVGVHGITSQST